MNFMAQVDDLHGHALHFLPDDPKPPALRLDCLSSSTVSTGVVSTG
jgi:hypothetical protein